MEESFPTMVDDRVKELTKTQVPVDSLIRNYMSGHILHVRQTQVPPTSVHEQQQQLYLTMRDIPQLPSAVRPRDQDDPHDDAHPEGENSAKRQKMSEHGTFVIEESSSSQDFESEQGPSTSANQEQLDDFDFWTDSYATDDDEIPNEKVSQ
ncbi:hypothetical protein Tco_1407684 [Tanacetum coccineum]